MLSQLVYISVRSSDCTDAEIQKILEASIRNNGKINITGVLLFSDTKFIQCLEGEYDLIISLYDKIKLDKRHKNVVMLGLGPIKERYFPSWQMGSKKVSLKDVDFNTQMSDAEKVEFKGLLTGDIIQNQQNQRFISTIRKFF
jgi:hypothetical protein